MKKHFTLRNATLLAALATVSAAWAASEMIFTPPAQSIMIPIDEKVLNPTPPVIATETLERNETVVMPLEPTPAVERAAPLAPVVERPTVGEPPITIEHKRLTLDERIQADVLDRIAGVQNVSGKVGVETHDAVVTLTGRVTNAGQAYRVERMARSVDGVRDVDNRIRARVGGST